MLPHNKILFLLLRSNSNIGAAAAQAQYCVVAQRVTSLLLTRYYSCCQNTIYLWCAYQYLFVVQIHSTVHAPQQTRNCCCSKHYTVVAQTKYQSCEIGLGKKPSGVQLYTENDVLDNLALDVRYFTMENNVVWFQILEGNDLQKFVKNEPQESIDRDVPPDMSMVTPNTKPSFVDSPTLTHGVTDVFPMVDAQPDAMMDTQVDTMPCKMDPMVDAQPDAMVDTQNALQDAHAATQQDDYAPDLLAAEHAAARQDAYHEDAQQPCVFDSETPPIEAAPVKTDEIPIESLHDDLFESETPTASTTDEVKDVTATTDDSAEMVDDNNPKQCTDVMSDESDLNQISTDDATAVTDDYAAIDVESDVEEVNRADSSESPDKDLQLYFFMNAHEAQQAQQAQQESEHRDKDRSDLSGLNVVSHVDKVHAFQGLGFRV